MQQTCPKCGTVFIDLSECPTCAAIRSGPPKTATAMHQQTCYVCGAVYTAFTNPAPCPTCATQPPPAPPVPTARLYLEFFGIWTMLTAGFWLGFRRTWPLWAILAVATVVTLVRVFWLKNVGSFKEDKTASRRLTFIGLGLVGAAVVVGLLAAAIPALVSVSESNRRDRAKADIQNLERAVEAWRQRTGDYPASLEELTKDKGGERAGLDAQALKDPWGNSYHYDPSNINPARGTPLIYSTGGTEDGAGVIANW